MGGPALALDETVQLSILALTAIALILSVFFNKATIEEMKMARKSQVMPNIKGHFSYHAPTIGFFVVQNLGSGPAIDMEATISLVPKKADSEAGQKPITYSWRDKILVPGDSEEFMLKTASVKELKDQYQKVTLEAKFKNIYGDRYDAKDELLFQDLLGPSEGIKQLWRDPRIIEKNIEKIGNGIDALTRKIEALSRTP
jgi:hypothetical protein